jgi:hypothetical protein
MLWVGCDGGAPAVPGPSAPSTPHVARDAGALAPRDAARTITVAPPPPQAACTPPTAAERTRLETQIRAWRKLINEDDSAAVRFVCAERAGWLVEIATKPPTAWLVPAHGDPTMLDGWTIGPVYDVDGDGRPEATTIGYTSELKIWFDAPAGASFVLDANGTQWLARGGKVLVGSDDSAFEVVPGKAYVNFASGVAAQPHRDVGYSCTSDDHEAAEIAHMLMHGRSPAPCAQLPAADKATQESAIATAMITRIDLAGVIGIHFEWGCTSHGETPVVVDYDGMRDNTGVEVWTIHDGKATQRDGVTSSAPGEYSSHDGIALGSFGDFDGDGAAESIFVHSHHASAHGTTFAYKVMVGGVMRALPSDLVVRAAVGDRDGVVGTQTTPHVMMPCHSTDPNTQLDCELQPPADYVRADSCGPWDWDKHPPQIVALGTTSSFTPITRAAVTAIVRATKDDRTALQTPAP